jgi:hypothetical protein
MSGIKPNFDEWRILPAIEIWEIAVLMHGYDPRALGDVIVGKTDASTDPQSGPLDTSWEEKRLIAAVHTNDLLSAPANVNAPDVHTKISVGSLLPWLVRIGNFDALVKGLTPSTPKKLRGTSLAGPIQSPNSGIDAKSTSAPTESAPGSPIFSVRRSAMIAQYAAKWPTIEADLKDAASNGLSKAKAGQRDWNEAVALEWARSRNKLIKPSESAALAGAMNNIVGRKHSSDD